MSRRLISVVLAAVLGLLPFRVWATSVVPPDFDTLVNDADYVVRAVVKSVTSEWKETAGHKYIGTKVQLEIQEIVRGKPPQTLTLEMVGGRVGQDALIVEGAPQFLVGDEDILFVQGNGKQVYPLVAIMHGRYPVYHDAQSGTEYVVRSNGMPLYSEQDVSLPMTALSSVKVQNPAAKPMTVAAFEQKIRAVNPASARAEQLR